MKFCRFLGMEGSRFGLVETRDGQDFIISELGSPQMQVSGAGVPERIVLPEPGSGKKIDEPFPLERAKLLIPFPSSAKSCAWDATMPRTSANWRMRCRPSRSSSASRPRRCWLPEARSFAPSSASGWITKANSESSSAAAATR